MENVKQVAVPDMLKKLDEMYQEQENIVKQVKGLKLKYLQLTEDIELLQNMIMYQSNKLRRQNG